MKKINNIKKVLRIIMLLLLIAIVVYAVLIVLPNKPSNPQGEVIDKVDNYVLYKRDTDLYKEEFNKFKEELNGTKDIEKCAEYISKLFIIDLYTLSNKDNKNDVGGIQYVYEASKDNFVFNASNTIYKYINDMDRPTVSNVTLRSTEKTTYKIKDKEYEAYLLELSWEYENYAYTGNFIVKTTEKNMKAKAPFKAFEVNYLPSGDQKNDLMNNHTYYEFVKGENALNTRITFNVASMISNGILIFCDKCFQ